MHTKAKSAWMIAGAGALWGMIALFVRALNAAGLSALEIVFFRNLLAAAALGVVVAVRDRSALRIRLRDVWMFVGTGMVSIELFNLCYFYTLSRSSVAVAALLLYTSPVFVLLLSILLFRERLTAHRLAAIVITIAGCACITGVFSQAQAVAPMTVLCGLGSGLFYALYSIFGKFALRRYSAMTVSFYTFVFAALATAPFSAAHCTQKVLAQPHTLLVGLGLAAVCTVVPFLLYTGGLDGVPASQAAVLATVEPLVGSLLGVVVFGDPFTIWTVLGMALILSSILVLQLPPRRRPAVEEANG